MSTSSPDGARLPVVETRIVSRSPDATRAAAFDLARAVNGPMVIALHGELGSGKTCFVQGIADALGVKGLVTSPTFVLVNELAGVRRLIHMDLYRLRSPDEALALGLEEYLESDAVTAIEWPDRAEGLLPTHTIHVWISVAAGRADRIIRLVRPT